MVNHQVLVFMHVSNYKSTFSPMHLVFLEIDMHQHHLGFKILDENNDKVIPRKFYLQLLNKQRVYMTIKQKFIQIKTLPRHKNQKHID